MIYDNSEIKKNYASKQDIKILKWYLTKICIDLEKNTVSR